MNVKIYARRPQNVQMEWSAIDGSADLCVLCVPDRMIEALSAQIPEQEGVLVHSSGTIPLEALDGKHQQRGILYPLMSLRADSKVDIKTIPFCLEASSEAVFSRLEEWCKDLGLLSYPLNSETRRSVHLGAVIGHNFSNFLYHWSFQVLRNAQLPLEILRPLLQQQLQELSNEDPILKQTGPAVRKDEETIQAHLQMIETPELAQVYEQISRLIQSEHEKEL